MVESSRRARREPLRLSSKEYARTIGTKVAARAPEIIAYGTRLAAARLAQLRKQNDPTYVVREDAYDIAAEAFKRLLSGERRDWDGNADTLHQAIAKCIGGILSSRRKREHDSLTSSIEDVRGDWSNEAGWVFELESPEGVVDRPTRARLVRDLFPPEGYEVEALILAAMIFQRALAVDTIAAQTALSKKQVSKAFVRMASYAGTDEFAERYAKVFAKTGYSTSETKPEASPFASGLVLGLCAQEFSAPIYLMRLPPKQDQDRDEIINRMSDWAGGKVRARTWYRSQPIAAFGGRTAESLVKSGQASALRDYLDHIATGGFA